MPPMILPPELSTGMTAMDALHQDFFDALSDLCNAPDSEFCLRYGAFLRQAEHVFFIEEQWMEDIDFSLAKTHREQHARALAALHHMHACMMGGELAAAREAVERLLPAWCIFHMATMDAELAAAMQLAGADIGQSAPLPQVSCAD